MAEIKKNYNLLYEELITLRKHCLLSENVIENFIIRGFTVNSFDLGFDGLSDLAPMSHVPTEFP